MTSAQIAQMHGSFQGQSMNQMAYSNMIGQPSPYSGERMAGGVANTLGAVGAPVAMGAMALGGLDPFSMALTGARSGFAAGGLGGAAAGGLAAAGAVGGGIMAAGWAGGQMMQGAQQQQQLGAGLRSSFGFRNQFGGSGFGSGEVGQIGSSMRQMASQQGPGGEMTNFDELGRLASNMGRMGMSQGVRNAKDFTEKFKTMVSSLKEIATEMGTSLEEAQKMMAGMKQSGVFGAKNQVAMSKAIRAGASAGGMATSELTGMGSVGSQISRMVGGRGAAGAAGGMETLTNIGVAQQMGILSEEDIYNATGETGAMGRRSLASSQMQGAARFLKGGLGRRMMAAMAGKDGMLDEESAQEFEEGGVSVERTREMWKKNMKNVGRANFIRNEGKMRGEMLKRFGGLAPAVAMRGWMEGKGIDVNEDNDRAMLFMQRRLHMGRDEADVMMKQIQSLPQILKERSIVAKEDAAAQTMAQRQKGVGIEGLKRKMDAAVASVKGDIQQVGADAMEELSNEFEGVINWLTNTRTKTFRKDAVRAQANLLGGGTAARQEFNAKFGVGGGGAAKGVAGMAGMASQQKSDMEVGGSIISKMLGLGGGFNNEFERDREVLSKSGYDVAGGMGQGKTEAKLRELRTFAEAAGGEGVGIKLEGKDTFSKLQTVYSNVGNKKGLQRAAALEKELLASDSPEMKKMGQRLRDAKSDKERGDIIAGIGKAAGREGEGSNYTMPDAVGVYNTSEYLTATNEKRGIGKLLMGSRGQGWQGESWRKSSRPSDDVIEAMGDFAKSDAGRDILSAALGADSTAAADATKKMQSDITDLESRSSLDVTQKGQLTYLKRLRASKKVLEAGGGGISDKDLARIAKEEGFDSVKELRTTAGAYAKQLQLNQRENRFQADTTPAKERLESMREAGAIKDGKLTGKVELEGTEKDFFKAMMEGDTAMANMVRGSEGKALEIRSAAQAKMDETTMGMSVAQKRQLAAKLRKAGQRERASDISSDARVEERLGKGGKGKALTNLAGMLGSDMSRSDLRGALDEGGSAEVTSRLLEDMDLKSESNQKLMLKAVEAQRAGKSGEAREALQGIMTSDEFKKRKEEKDEAATAAKNPLQAKANEHLKSIEDLMTLQKAAMTRIATNTEPLFGGGEDES